VHGHETQYRDRSTAPPSTPRAISQHATMTFAAKLARNAAICAPKTFCVVCCIYIIGRLILAGAAE
jgi:hypothetical protein